MDQIMTAETFKTGQSAKLWNWLDRMRFDHQRHSVKDLCKVKLSQADGSVADITPANVLPARCLTQDENPTKRRWNTKRMKRHVSCYVFTSGNVEVERKYRSHNETHFPSSKPIPQRVRAAKSIQNLTSVDTIDRQNTRTGLRNRLSWHRLADGNNSCKGSRLVVTSGVNDTIPVFDDEDDRNDAMTQTCALDLWAASLPHIDSDVSDDDDDGYCCYDSREYAKALVLPTSSELNQTHSGAQPENIVHPKEKESTIKEEMPNSLAADAAPLAVHTTTGRMTGPMSVESLNPLVMDCGVYLPGCRHRGRALVVADLSLLRSHLPPVSHLAQLVAYYQTVPRKSAAKNGLVLLVAGRPDQSSSAFGLIEQLLCHFHERQQKCIDDVVIWSEGGAVPETSLRLSGRTCDVITSSGQLRERLAAALSLGCCGGPIAHNQHDWIAFRKIVEPFLSSCRQRSKVLYQVISSVRSQMATTSPAGAPLHIQAALEELDKLYNASSCNPDLIGLLAEGPRILQEVSNAKTRLGGDNVDARETMERCSALYAEVQRSVGRLARVCERRKAQLEKHLPSPPTLPAASKEDCDDVDDGAARIGDGHSLSACRQILSWLCRKGEETLSRYHVTLADSLAAAKSQQREFQRFLVLAQKQIVKGKELLEELQRDSGVTATPGSTLAPAEPRDEQLAVGEDPVGSSAGRTISSSNTSILDLASSLQSQLSKFGHRLDDTRERLEDTSRCYELLDKAYEWGVEAMKLASKLKLDQQPCPPSVASHLLHQVDAFLSTADKISHTTALEDLNTLARKLDNPKLLDQCKLAQNRCQETMELLEFRRRILTDYVKEDETKRQEEQHQAKQRQDKDEVETNIYENVAELNASSSCEDKVDGLSKDYPIWKKNETGNQLVRAADDGNCVLLRVKKNSSPDALAKQQQQQPNSVLNGYPPLPLRGTTSYSSGTSLSSYSSSSTSWSSRMKLAMNRKMSTSGTEPTLPADDVSDGNKMDKSGVSSTGSSSKTEEEEDHSEEVSVCQSPISVNSHLQCRASSIDLSLPIAEMQESGFTEDNIKSQKTLFLTMREMIQTERDYVRSLEYIIENYIPELSREDIPQALRGKRNVIFGNIEKIYGFHHHYFLRELEHCHNVPFLVGQCFLRHEQHFYLYALYNKNKPKSDALMAEYGTAFFRRKQTELGDKMDLASYLLKPVQRMGKYALLLKQLLKESGDKEPEFVDLLAAEQMVRFQLRHGNDLLAMDSLRDCDVNVKEQGRLIRQSEFYCWQGRKKGLRHVFLFEDLILFSKAKRDPERKNLDIYIYKHSMKTSDIGFTAKMGESSTRFEIWFRKRKPNETIVMEATNPDVKQMWVDDISRILWKQALRNRELRMTEMAEMGIGNKPCLDIRPSQDQINDRSISYAQLAKAPKFRHSVCGSILSDSRSSKRPHSIISVSSSASSASSGSGSVNDNRISNSNNGHQDSTTNTALVANLHNHRSKTNQSQCSAESGILADLSMSYDDPESGHCRIGRSDSSITTESVDSVTLSPSSPLTSSKSCPYPSMTPISLYVNNKLIPITPSPSHKNMPMTEM
ncbi:uncharacterized protein LOC130701846 isoform X2 [Daphnia carinata]|uniref:uncharacterized protein LOC130701846 isoform X2 n=1 Tax=Daphnia carinata TaxID=120202 RepID=UPI002868FA1B|nr:uncharacterized protein LOC130701846 isoform X2 [Daphnia carinata]